MASLDILGQLKSFLLARTQHADHTNCYTNDAILAPADS